MGKGVKDEGNDLLMLRESARALASPIRTCTMTHIRLPRFFLQDFEAVNHPKTGEMWMAAGPLAFENVQPKYRPLEGGEAEITVDGEQSNENPAPIESQSNDLDGKLTDDTATSTSLSPSKSSPEENSSSITDGEVPERTSKAPITVYTLTNRSLFDKIGKERRHVGKLIGGRSGMAYMPVSRAAVFRHDMGDVILKMMRQTLVDALVARSTSSVSGSPGTQIERIESWDDARNVKERGSVLLLSGDDTEAIKAGSDVTEPFPAYLTLDVDGASYDRKIPVYDLNRLLGAEEVARLRGSAPAVFGRNETQGRSGQQKYVLKRKSSHSSTNLHLLLWRIEGYLAETRAPASSA